MRAGVQPGSPRRFLMAGIRTSTRPLAFVGGLGYRTGYMRREAMPVLSAAQARLSELVRRRTSSAMRSATSSGSSCSHARTTSQPAAAKTRSVSASRSRLRSSFRCQYCLFVDGTLPCSGQLCQKQPSTKSARRARVKTTSARRRRTGTGRKSTRYLRPRACNADRTAISGFVSRPRLPRILLRTAGDDAHEPGGGRHLVDAFSDSIASRVRTTTNYAR